MDVMDIIEENIDNQLIVVNEDKDEIKINCLFKDLVKIYEKTELQLIECETKAKQKIRGATGSKVIQKLNLLVQYSSELEKMLGSLDKYIICEKHYNQVIRNDNFIEKLQNN